MFTHQRRRLDASVNAGSMADIAFLLLIFFLVSTKIFNEKGILIKLPPYVKASRVPMDENHVLTVRINSANKLLVENEPGDIFSLKARTKYHIMNPDNRPDLPPNPRLSIISLQNDRGTSYKTYIEVYNELKAAYNELWDDAARQLYGRQYASLPDDLKMAIRKDIPLVISEAEPTDFNNDG